MPRVMTLVPFLVLQNSKFSLSTPFSCFGNWIRLTTDVRTTGGSLPVFLGAIALRGEASVLAESMSMSVARSRVKKFQLATSLGEEVFTDGGIFACNATFFTFLAVSSELHGSLPPGLVSLCLLWFLFSSEKILAFSRPFNSLRVTVYDVPYRAL